jgi:hypothetical protein
VGAQTIGAKDIGAQTIGSKAVGAQTIGSKAVGARVCRSAVARTAVGCVTRGQCLRSRR